jgi:hypothetical protein
MADLKDKKLNKELEELEKQKLPSEKHLNNEHKQLEELEKDFEKKFKTSKLSKKISLKDKSK